MKNTHKMKRRQMVVVCAGMIALLMFASCERDYGLDVGDYNSIGTIVYSQHVQPIFTQKCATSGCHNAETAAEDLVMDSWSSLIQGSHHGAMVIPFRPEKSHLIFHVNRNTAIAPVAEPQMPPDKPLSGDEVNFLMRWIREGAKNDFEQVPFEEPRHGRVLVTNQADDEIAVIDVSSNLLMRMVSVGSLDNRVTPPEAPHNIVVDPLRQVYYVNMIVANEIWKFDARENEFLGKLSLGAQRSPAQIALSLDGTKGYVTNFDLTKTHRAVQIFDTQTMQVTDEISDQRMQAPHGITRTPDGGSLWVACQQSDNIAILSVGVDVDDEIEIVKVDSTVPDLATSDYTPKFGPYQLVFTSDGRYAYLTCRFSNEVRVFDTETKELVKIIPVGVNPLILDITPDDRLVYVANRGTGASPSRSVSVINTFTQTEIMKIENVGVEPHGVVVSPTGEYIYVSCENVSSPDEPHHPVEGLNTPGIVAVINAQNEVIKRIEVGAFAAGIAFLPVP
ncbi:MAG TPA: YncE family protein [Bacteroidota bacterium]